MARHGRRNRIGTFLGVATAVIVMHLGTVLPAHAGCGCNKPPPDLASVRPNATYPGMPVTLFSSSFQVGQTYAVDFISGTTSSTATVIATVVNRRDLADGVYKPQLVVNLPTLPLGPTQIKVRLSNLTTPMMTITDDAFTVAPVPVAMPQSVGSTSYPGFTAAIGRDGTFYFSLDMTAVSMPRVYEAQALGYPLSFGDDDVAFHNAQGFLMQLLVNNKEQPIPGMFRIASSNPTTDSDLLHYSRHEFNTYYLQHYERQPHQLDPNDPNWHIDGTRHVDHNHLILSIAGTLPNGVAPTPGATPPFTLVLKCFTLFSQGFVGRTGITLSGSVTTDSYAPGSATPQQGGDVYTNGPLTLSNSAKVNGSASAASYNISGSAVISGTRTTVTTPLTFMPIILPAGLPSMGNVKPSGAITLQGPGSFLVNDLVLNQGASLYVDNTAGPVTLYVNGQFAINGGCVTVADPNPEKFAVYVTGTKDVSLTNAGNFDGVVYAPNVNVSLSGNGDLFGSFVGAKVQASGNAKVHFDSALK